MKLLNRSLAIALSCSFFVAQGQTTNPLPSKQQSAPPVQTRGDVVRITTNLVQVDVTVLDHSGQPVSDLTPDDFEVTEDGRPQKISNLSFIATASAPPRPSAPAPATKRAKGIAPEPPLPPVTLRPDQVRRAIALVVDDLGLSFESSHFVRQTLKKFVDKQMEPGDLVAIIRTGAGRGIRPAGFCNRRRPSQRDRRAARSRARKSGYSPLPATSDAYLRLLHLQRPAGFFSPPASRNTGATLPRWQTRLHR